MFWRFILLNISVGTGIFANLFKHGTIPSSFCSSCLFVGILSVLIVGIFYTFFWNYVSKKFKLSCFKDTFSFIEFESCTLLCFVCINASPLRNILVLRLHQKVHEYLSRWITNVRYFCVLMTLLWIFCKPIYIELYVIR